MGPFEEHIREAIAVNRERAALYARATDGASNGVFRRFIVMQHVVLPFARWFDWRARRYEAAGVPLLSSIFESMSKVPEICLTAGEKQGDDGWSPDTRAMRRALLAAFRDGGFGGAAKRADDELRLLAARPWRDCMLRHQLESIVRLCTVGPDNIRDAIARGLSSPEPLLRRLLYFHLRGVSGSLFLDRPALPLQRKGIPILERDLPVVSPRPHAND